MKETKSVCESASRLPDSAIQSPGSAETEKLYALAAEAEPIVLTGERRLTAQAMLLLIRIDRELLEARAQWNQDWFRRLMRIRPQVVCRLRRRWSNLNPTPAVPLGNLGRRFPANVAGYLYDSKH